MRSRVHELRSALRLRPHFACVFTSGSGVLQPTSTESDTLTGVVFNCKHDLESFAEGIDSGQGRASARV
eukprot:1771606-Pleurochrysis_carterae.AAC.3